MLEGEKRATGRSFVMVDGASGKFAFKFAMQLGQAADNGHREAP